MTDINAILSEMKIAADELALSDTDTRNRALTLFAKSLRDSTDVIVGENAKDVARAKEAGKSKALIDRLSLDMIRVESMALALESIVALPDPLGERFDFKTRPNGLRVSRMRIPLGVIGIIFESRPNVVADAGSLCLKSGNAVILRGGSEAACSNKIIGEIMREAIVEAGLPAACVHVLEDTDRQRVLDLLQARGKLDLLIPRGGEGLIRFVDENARVPVILHYKGVCHVYVDKGADLDKAVNIIQNAKVQRPGVCNAAETLLVHQDIAGDFLPRAAEDLQAKGVELRGCEQTRAIIPGMKPATEADWDAEYLDLILAVRVVKDMDAAMAHIRRHGSGHSEAIVTENYSRANRFLNAVMSSCVLVNASTRFNDGGELGLGAEIGISTTKLHAFGPMGLRELTTAKFIVEGDGQIRE